MGPGWQEGEDIAGEGSCQEVWVVSVFIIAAIAITTTAIKKCFLQVSNYVGGFAGSL